MPPLAAWQWALGALCALFAGIAKTGVPGLGILVVPLMVLVVGDARASAGWLLPLLCAADLFAIAYYRRHAAAWRLFSLLPGVALGMAVGALALGMSERGLRPLIGAIVLTMIAAHLWRKRKVATGVPGGWRHSALYGSVAGFATMVANAAGPVMNVYLLSRELPKEEFIATGAWFFFVINLSKLPVYGVHGMLSTRSLLFDLVMLPALAAGALSGRALFRMLPQRVFEATVLLLTAAASLLLLLPSFRH